jgi:pimeloyl-ACP methyl ester carboxylesterase
MPARPAGRRVAGALVLAVAGCAATPPAPLAVPHVAERPVHRAHANGLELAWDSFGDPHAPPLLLVMGLGMQLIAWDEAFCRALAARGFYVIRFDNRDVGLSTGFDALGDPNPLAVFDALRRKQPVRAPYLVADLADDAIGLLDALGLPAAHVVGLSLGGMVAQAMAIRHPERVLTLTSIMSTTGDPSLRGPSYETIAALLEPFPPARDAFIARSVRLAHTLAGGGFVVDDARVRRLAARSFDRAYHPSGTRRQLVAIALSGSRKAALSRLELPTLVFHGDADPLIPLDGGQDTARSIPGARLDVVHGLGHELPPAVWPRLIDDIARLSARAPRPQPSAGGGAKVRQPALHLGE